MSALTLIDGLLLAVA